MILFRYDAKDPCCQRWLTISARFSFHQNEFNVVFYNRVRLIGFSEERGAIFNFVIRIRDFMPNDGGQVVKTYLTTMFLYGGMKRNNGMATIVLTTGQANITHNANKTTAGNQCRETLLPHFIQFQKKFFIVGDMSELTVGTMIFF